MAQFQDLFSQKDGVLAFEQYGIEWPDGSVMWGDPVNGSRVKLPGSVFNDRAVAPADANPMRDGFYLEPDHKIPAHGAYPPRAHDERETFKRVKELYVSTLRLAHAFEDDTELPQLIKRRVTLTLGAGEGDLEATRRLVAGI